MNWQMFLEELRKLKPSGKDGFEDLVKDLLESLTGYNYFLSRTGSQDGKDIISEEIKGNRIFVECKLYDPNKKNSKPTESALREKLADTIVKNVPDVWILVTTTHRINAQTYESLSQYCYIHGIEFFVIDTKKDDNSDLATLCCTYNNPQSVIRYLKDGELDKGKTRASNNTLHQIENYLVNLSKQPSYSQRLQKLKAKFAHESIGFNNWHARQNEWLLECFASEKESRATFGQSLNIRETGIDVIERQGAYGKLDTWLTTWGKHYSPFVMLGEEGDGKTWAIAAWLAKNIKKLSPIIFITSKLVSSNEPITLLANTLKKQLSEPRDGYWEKRLEKNWLQHRAKTSKPLLILVLDGLNENIKFDWRGLLESLDVEDWRGRIALILTCRTAYWKRHFEYLHYSPEHIWTLPSFNEKELSQALATKGLNRTDIPQSVMNLISKPRYFDLMVQLKDKIADSGDVTVERLIYEDWKDRTRRKTPVDNLNNEDFLSLISEISEKFQDKTSLKRAELEIYLTNSDLFEEFISSKILISVHGKYKVNKHFLVIGLGKLLANEVFHIANDGITAIKETIASLLKHQSDIDIKAKICGAALYQALIANDFPESARKVLFLYWINQQNIETETWDRVPAYFPIRPETYLNVAEDLWSSSSYNKMAQDMMMVGFLKYREDKKIKPILLSRFERWMSFIHLYGYAYQGSGEKDEQIQEERQKIAKCLGKNNIDKGPIELAGHSLTIITDEGLLQLARVALAVISHQPRKPYIKAITTGILARTIMGHVNFESEVAWTMLTAPDNIFPLVEKEAKQLLDVNMTVSKQAAYWLLTYSGYSKAYQLRQQLPENLVSKNWIWEQCRDNPCELFCRWTRDNYQTCLSKTNNAFLIAKALTHLALEPELPIPDNLSQKLEPIREEIPHEKLSTYLGQTHEDFLLKEVEATVCAFAPNILADILKRFTQSLPQRTTQILYKAAQRIQENMLIMTDIEKQAIYQAWNTALMNGTTNEDLSHAEDALFSCVIYGKSAKEQIELLLLRENKTTYSNKCPPIFNSLPATTVAEYLQKTEEKTDNAFLTNVLWFLSANPKSIPNDAEKYLLNLLDSDQSHIRASVLKIIFGMENQALGKAVIDKGWQWSNKNYDEENHWGSLILSEFGIDRPYSDLLFRISPTLAGYMLERRGCDKEEILQYADYLMEIWKRISGQQIAISDDISKMEIISDVQSNEVSPEYSKRFSNESDTGLTFYSMDAIWGGILRSSGEQQSLTNLAERETQLRQMMERVNKMLTEQREAHNFWLGNIVWLHGLREVTLAHKNYVNIWLAAVFSETNQATKILVACQSFYQTLCSVLLEVEPEKGIKLYDLLQSSKQIIRFIDIETKVESLTYKLFSAPYTEIVTERWYSHLDNCSNDRELKIAAFVIQDTKQEKWLHHVIKNWLKSERRFDQARALRLLGFLDSKTASEELQNWINTQPDSWLKNIAKHSLESFKKNSWAKWWFKDFLTNENDVRAWGSFRVFLKCVDHRFWLWSESMITGDIQIKPGRKLFYQENIENIKKQIEENDKPLKKHFLDTKVMEDQVWPWMKKYVS